MTHITGRHEVTPS